MFYISFHECQNGGFFCFFISCGGQFKWVCYLMIFACKISLLRTKKTVQSKKQTSLQSLGAFHPFGLQPVCPTNTQTSSRKIFFQPSSCFVLTLWCIGHLCISAVIQNSSRFVSPNNVCLVPAGKHLHKKQPNNHTKTHSEALLLNTSPPLPKNKLHSVFTQQRKR